MNIESFCLGREVIVRTHSAGVWFGILEERQDRVVLLRNARCMWCWWCKESISLSGVVAYGIIEEKSKITAVSPYVILLEAIEILPIEGEAADTIRNASIAKQE